MRSTSARILCLGISAALPASAWGGVSQPSAFDPNPYSVVRPESIAPFFAAARVRRVDMAIIGDSNTRALLTSGLEDAFSRSLTARYGCYGTRVDPVAGIGGSGAEIFFSSSRQNSVLTDGAPPEVLSDSLPIDAGFPAGYAYLADGHELGPSNNLGLTLLPGHPLGLEGPLRWHLTQTLFPITLMPTRIENAAPPPALPGRFMPTCRAPWPGNAWQNYVRDEVMTTSPGGFARSDWHMDLPAGARSPYGVLFCLTNTGEQASAYGPFFARWNRVENLDRTSGLAYSTLLYQGGQTTRDAAISLVTRATQPQMSEWFRQVTRLQNGEPTLLIQITQGANDAASSLPALVYNRGDLPRPPGQWLVGAPTNKALGYRQNTLSVINRLRDFWSAAGYDLNNLYFLIDCYFPHPADWNGSRPGSTDGAQYVAFHEEALPAWREICLSDSRIAMLDGYQLSTPEEFIAHGWYRYTSPFYNDHAHLSASGYAAWGEAVAEAVKRACDCGPSADIDLNGRREVPDIFAFLSLWFAADPRANFDGVGDSPAVPDIFAFLSSWFAGCAGH